MNNLRFAKKESGTMKMSTNTFNLQPRNILQSTWEIFLTWYYPFFEFCLEIRIFILFLYNCILTVRKIRFNEAMIWISITHQNWIIRSTICFRKRFMGIMVRFFENLNVNPTKTWPVIGNYIHKKTRSQFV